MNDRDRIAGRIAAKIEDDRLRRRMLGELLLEGGPIETRQVDISDAGTQLGHRLRAFLRGFTRLFVMKLGRPCLAAAVDPQAGWGVVVAVDPAGARTPRLRMRAGWRQLAVLSCDVLDRALVDRDNDVAGNHSWRVARRHDVSIAEGPKRDRKRALRDARIVVGHAGVRVLPSSQQAEELLP